MKGVLFCLNIDFLVLCVTRQYMCWYIIDVYYIVYPAVQWSGVHTLSRGTMHVVRLPLPARTDGAVPTSLGLALPTQQEGEGSHQDGHQPQVVLQSQCKSLRFLLDIAGTSGAMI